MQQREKQAKLSNAKIIASLESRPQQQKKQYQQVQKWQLQNQSEDTR